MEKRTKKILVMQNGARYEVTGENGKYYLCGEVSFRKANPQIAEVVKEKVKEIIPEEMPEEKEVKEEKPKRKPVVNGRKKGE